MGDDYWYRTWGPPLRAGGRPSLSVIVPELLVGEYPVPNDAPWLRDAHGVTAVVNLQDDADLDSKGVRLRDLAAAYTAAGLSFQRLPITDCDMAMLATRLDESVRVVADAVRSGGRVYLHCNAGMNRAPTVAIAYLHVHRGLPLRAACAHVKQRRQCVPYMTVLEARYAVPPR